MGQVAYHGGRLPHCKLTGSWKLYFCLLYLAKRVFGENEYYNYYRRKYYWECCWICRFGRKSLYFAPFHYKVLTASGWFFFGCANKVDSSNYVSCWICQKTLSQAELWTTPIFPFCLFCTFAYKKWKCPYSLLAAFRRRTVFAKCIDNLETIKSLETLPLVCCDGHANMYDTKTY